MYRTPKLHCIHDYESTLDHTKSTSEFLHSAGRNQPPQAPLSFLPPIFLHSEQRSCRIIINTWQTTNWDTNRDTPIGKPWPHNPHACRAPSVSLYLSVSLSPSVSIRGRPKADHDHSIPPLHSTTSNSSSFKCTKNFFTSSPVVTSCTL